MFRRTLFSALAVAAGTAAALLIRSLTDKDEPETEEDEEIRFISIKDDDTPEAVQQVCAVYPDLDPDFVAGLLSRSSELNARYPEDTLVAVTHNVSFPEKEMEAIFVDIMEPAGYECTGADDGVKAVRKFFTVEGAVLSDVLNVANQTNALSGEYKGYEVEEVNS